MSLKISVVTPNYNCVNYIEQTILSVILQDYPNLEYIIVDGGSTDGSLAIIERYQSYFAYVISEPDDGHADALNKGFSLATGDVLCWINSDDLLMPGSLAVVDRVFDSFQQVQWITGIPSVVDETGLIRRFAKRDWSWQRFLCGDFRYIQQESTFWRRSLWEESGGYLDADLDLAVDFELWLRFFRRAALHTVERELGCFRIRKGQRSTSLAEEYEAECGAALATFIDNLPITHLVDHIGLVPDDQLTSRRLKPAQLPSQLGSFDPSRITISTSTGLPEMSTQSNSSIPCQNSIDIQTGEDLVFDGHDRVVWVEGPDFSKNEVNAIEIALLPFAPSVVVLEPLSDYSPPMPCVIGPMSLADWGNGKHTIQVRFAEGAVSHDLYLSEIGRRYRIRLLLEEKRYTLLLDGHTVATGKSLGKQRMQAPVAIIGGGHAQRYWLGAFEKVTVVLRDNGEPVCNGPRTYELSHVVGKFSLPRQRRPSFAKPQLLPTKLREQTTPLSRWRDKHKGQRCFVMGNGPSLNKMDLNKLVGETVFACNAVFLLFDRVEWRPTYYSCVDTRVIRDRAKDISEMLDSHPHMTAFFPAILHLHDGSGQEFAGREIIKPRQNTLYFNEVGNRQSHHVETMFSLDADDYVVQPYTVAITMLQLAVYMGFSDIYLIGCDTSYKVPETVEQEGRQVDGVGLCLTSTHDDDDNHFDPRYFGQGREWHNPQVASMIEHYRWANLAARRVGARIRNATVGGQLEVFERIGFNDLFPAVGTSRRIPLPPSEPLLSIAIPAYGRSGPLLRALQSFAAQIDSRFEGEVEIVVSDDCTPNDGLRAARAFAATRSYMHWRRYGENIGLERNLLACANTCTGKYLWIFGDDDFLEADTAIELVLEKLRQGQHDVLVLNRTRRSTDLQTIVSPNWMGLDTCLLKSYSGLREFCLEFGLISVLGFISINIFRRRHFQRVDVSPYMGTMYPQLGAMLEAFHSRPVLLVGEPLVCHRTQTQEEKKRALGNKASESDFMADSTRRNATYFSHPFIAMLDELVERGAFSYDDLMRIRENTVIDGLLIDFLVDCVRLNDRLKVPSTAAQWVRTAEFFSSLLLDSSRMAKIKPILDERLYLTRKGEGGLARQVDSLTISVVTPSFNQAQFLSDCLESVRDQTHPPIEHLVFDPGSNDGSREIAARFPHATLIAESDTGQSDALNKGFVRVSGDIVAWLNSDDCFAHSLVFERVVQRFLEADSPDIVYGRGIFINEGDEKLRDVYVNKNPSSLAWRFQQEDGILQPALFMKRSVIERVGPLRNDLHYCMDYEYWIRCVKAGIKFAFLDEDFAKARYHSNNKTYGMRGKSYSEVCDMMREHFGYVNHVWIRRYAEFLCEGHDGVLAHSGNVGIKDVSRLEKTYGSLLLAYNGSHDTFKLLENGAEQKGLGDTLREMKALGIGPAVPCEEIPLEEAQQLQQLEEAQQLDEAQQLGCFAYTVGPRSWAFDAKWKEAQIQKTHDYFRECIAKRRSDTCVIVGNGPSLNKTDLSLLQNQDVIVSNNAFLSSDLLKYATYFTVVNYLVAEQSGPHINRLAGIAKILPYWMAYCLNPGSNTYFVDAKGLPEFSKDIFKNMSWRHTVTFFNLHLAYGLGYRKVIMIGFDHNYKQPKGVAEEKVIQNYEEDENHFHPSYFRGKKWQAADVEKMEAMYSLAKTAFEEDGRIIINSTVGGKLELFPRMTLAKALGIESLQPSVLGPFDRSEHAHWDETDGIAKLFDRELQGATLVDVGAHHGTALAPFLSRRWEIFAFEPDKANREKLFERLANHKDKHLVSIDPRCVSNKPRKGVGFFTSEESTGISGLSAFHETHQESQIVDVTTLTDFFHGKPMPAVDFLKIDTEGHDLFVLEGFPWERGKPAVIECEFEDSKTVPLGYTFHDLAQFLVDKGYTVYVSEWHPIIRYGIRHDWRQLMRYPCRLLDRKGWGNLLAFRDPIDEQALISAVKRVLKIGFSEGNSHGAGGTVQKPTKLRNPAVAVRSTVASTVSVRPRRFRVESVPHFASISTSQWRYQHSEAEQKLWVAAIEAPGPTMGRTFIGNMRVLADRAMTVDISLGRHGRTEYEGAFERVELSAGVPQAVQVSKQFKLTHQTLKLQVEVVDLPAGASSILSITDLGIGEALGSVRDRIGSSNFDLRTANRLFREGDFAAALSIYLWLGEQRPLPMYGDNAVRAARRAGMAWLKAAKDAAWLLA